MVPGRSDPSTSATRIIDLTMPVVDGMDAFPGEPTARFGRFSSHAETGIEMWNVDLFTQLGTHLDAPSHFLAGGATVERLDLTACIGPCTLVDADVAAHAQVTPEHLQPYRNDLRRTRRVLVRTGWSVMYGTPSFWTDYPELSPQAAALLVDCGVRFLGLDTPSPHRALVHQLHHTLLGADVILAECLTNLGAIRAQEPYLVCLPLPLVGLDGSPVRCVVLEEETS